MTGLYKHIKSGRYYLMRTDKFMLKDMIDGKLEWRRDLVLYEALYTNPDGQFFSRMRKDFYASFKRIDIVEKATGNKVTDIYLYIEKNDDGNPVMTYEIHTISKGWITTVEDFQERFEEIEIKD